MNDKANPEPGVYTPAEDQINRAVAPIKAKLDQLSKDFIESHDDLGLKLEGTGKALHEFLDRIAVLEEKPDVPIDEIESSISALQVGIELTQQRMDNIEKPQVPDRASLYAALAKAQGEIQAAEANKEAEIRKKDDYNVILYTFKYADLAACLLVIRKPLSENGLALIQIPSLGDDNAIHMRTVLAHESGQTISCEMTMHPEKAGPQAIGTCMAYLRRYSLCSLIGVAQFDDDAASAVKGPDEYDRISTAEAEQIIIKADELCGDRADEVVARMLKGVFGGIDVVGDIRAGEAEVALTNLQNAAGLIKKKAKAAEAKDRKDKRAAEDEK